MGPAPQASGMQTGEEKQFEQEIIDSITALASPDLSSRTVLTETGSGGCPGGTQNARTALCGAAALAGI